MSYIHVHVHVHTEPATISESLNNVVGAGKGRHPEKCLQHQRSSYTHHWLLPTDLFLRGTGTVHPFRVIGVTVTVEEASIILRANAGPFTADSLTCQ